MMELIKKAKGIKLMYPKGTRVKLDRMTDKCSVEPRTEGTVNFVDDLGTIHVDWDNGRGLGLVVGEDQFTVL